MGNIDACTHRWRWIEPEAARRLSGTVTTDRICRRVAPKGSLSRLRRIGREIVESWQLMLV
ncbi:hypothetical protein PMI29_03958 [Pseudomonas sp. GM49]|uniref:hypothetical protein n=1 Tax=Pseudomonas sp. GM49 TaxID=1144331 RepID=UPI000270279A|nr:hypothetical protein [Pseudomonas sp. GM49]EJM61027.1 hypothetical protein PMI29_03958 [Pseudomonas sp. GM49]